MNTRNAVKEFRATLMWTATQLGLTRAEIRAVAIEMLNMWPDALTEEKRESNAREDAAGIESE